MRLHFACALAGTAVLSLALGVGCKAKPSASEESSSEPGSGMLAAEMTGEFKVVASEHGFSPRSIALPHGAPGSRATVTFIRTTDKTCATEVVFPDLDVRKDLPLGVPVSIAVPTDAARTLAFQCGMGMYKGALVVK